MLIDFMHISYKRKPSDSSLGWMSPRGILYIFGGLSSKNHDESDNDDDEDNDDNANVFCTL